ncbi:heat shock factor protein [Plectosphaerella plurivora]|uniref:Heat shock factor protein n=1 Tax=Plectosphaerella plurivora TaxID=936078 RepID=A0A9P8UZZ3_9PEZI|nr:heat shock factor protein [Plectosphaerella plurivora]
MQHRYGSPSSNNDMLRWHDGTENTAFVPGVPPVVNPYSMMAAPQQQPQAQPQQQAPQPQHQPQQQQSQQHLYGQGPAATPNNALARRQMNRALVPTNPRQNFDPSNDPWASFVDTEATSSSALLHQQQPNNAAMSEEQSVEALEELAAKAKQDATVKRKQIPPFVQKLSSFLDEKRNVELIRWSDKGDSFVVLDEDEFAKTLIPELFKHNNYASFVRQLNMYGFHKRVGLSDNSMRASERKNKSPSEYSNPYFRRGHPNLLWLINKPKSGNKKKAQASKTNADGEAESEEDVPVDEPLVPERVTNAAHPSRALPASGEMPMQTKFMTVIRDEVQKVRDQQKAITAAIDRLQRENSNLYSQAAIFQEQHDRHQNSINAILNFLANVFRKTLEDQSGTQNVNELFANIIPGVNANNTMSQGSVVDLGDFFASQAGGNPVGQPKRARGLLPPIPGPSGGRASTVASTPSNNATPQPFSGMGSSSNTNYNSGTVEELFDTPDNNSPEYLAQELRSNPHESMMKIIHDTNANNTTGLDLPEVVNNTPANMSNDQRQQILNNMMAQGSDPSTGKSPSAAPMAPTQASAPNVHATGSNPGAQQGQNNFSLSPIIGSNPRPPQFNQLAQNNNELEALRRMAQEHDNKIHHLQNMLVPLSPSGRIPDLDGNDLAQNYFGSPGPFDMDNFINEDAYGNNSSTDFPDVNFDTSGNDFNFSLLDDAGAGTTDHLAAPTPIKRGRGSSQNTPSPSGTEEILREDFDDAIPEAKRQRLHD